MLIFYRIIRVIFAILSIASLAAVISGAIHQLVVFAITLIGLGLFTNVIREAKHEN